MHHLRPSTVCKHLWSLFEICFLFCLLDGKWLQHFVFLAGLDRSMLWVPYETSLKCDQGLGVRRPRIERASHMPYALHFSLKKKLTSIVKSPLEWLAYRRGVPFTCAMSSDGLNSIAQSNTITNSSPVEMTSFKKTLAPLLYLHNIVSMEEQHS